MNKKRIEGEDLFEELEEGDQIVLESLISDEEILTVYRHVTEDDKRGQLITLVQPSGMKVLTSFHDFDAEKGDLIATEITSREFFVVRNERGKVCVLTKDWSDYEEEYKVSLWKIEEGSNTKNWQSYGFVEVYKVGEETVDRDNFASNLLPDYDSDKTIWASMDSNETINL